MDIERDDEEIRAEVMDDVKGWNQVNPDEEDENKEVRRETDERVNLHLMFKRFLSFQSFIQCNNNNDNK